MANRCISTGIKRAKISKKMREKILKRDKYSCRYCGVVATPIKRNWFGKTWIQYHVKGQPFGLEIDHKKPVVLGGSNHPNNLLTCCWKCNNKKGGKRHKEFLQLISKI